MIRLCDEIAASLPASGPLRITVVRAGGLGDTLLVMPALQLLLEALPRADLTLIGSAWAERLGPLVPFPLRLLRFDSPLLTPLFGPPGSEAPTGALSEAHAVVIYTACPDENLVRNARRACPGPVIEWPVQPDGAVHAALHFARAVAHAPGMHALPPPALHVPEELQQWADGWLARHFAAPARPVAVHPGSGAERKCWPAQRFARLIQRLDGPVLLLEGPADREACRRVEELVPPGAPLVNASGLGVPQVAALLARCRLYIGNDSGISHLAAALGAPTIAIFGPTAPAVWAPRGPQVTVAGGDRPGDLWPSAEGVIALLPQRSIRLRPGRPEV